MAISQEPIFLLAIITVGPALTEWIKAIGASRKWILPKRLAPLINMALVMSAGLLAWAVDTHNASAFWDTVETLLAASAIGQGGHTALSAARKRVKVPDD